MKNKKYMMAGGLMGCLALGSLWHFNSSQSLSHKSSRHLSDEALLALIKNDQSAFESFIKSGGDLQANLPVIDGQTFTVAEGLAYFERVSFINYLQQQKISFLKQNKDGSPDILSMAVKKNNPDLLAALMKEKPDLNVKYGEKNFSLMHLASSHCSSKLVDILHQQGKMNWDEKSKDGSNAMTIAAANDCLPMLSYWKDQKADFNKKDGRGISTMSLLKKNKDAAFTAFAQSFETARRPASAGPVKEVSFYKKRVIPKDQMIDHSALIEPEIRPLDANETAENSEFSD